MAETIDQLEAQIKTLQRNVASLDGDIKGLVQMIQDVKNVIRALIVANNLKVPPGL